MPNPDAANEANEGFPVPLASLSQPDDTEKMVTPAEGDAVSMQVDATVVSVQGETAFIKPTAINGKPLEAQGEAKPAEAPEGAPGGDLDQQEADLRKAMGQ
jgi:hypothetical protein